MATEKVIQDSDDEDFEETPTSANPLQQSPPSRSNDGGVAPPEGSEEAHSIVDTRQSIDEPSPNVASSNGLDVNFDDFLQSQSSTKRASISPLLSRQAQAPAEIGQSSGGTGNAQLDLWEPRPQSSSSLKLKRTQTMASLDEIGHGNNLLKKGAKRCKTLDSESSKPQSKQQLSSSEDDIQASEGQHILEAVASKTSKETEEINNTYTPLNGKNNPQKPSVRRGRTLGNDNVSSESRQKPSRRCASTAAKDMDDAWDRNQIGFKVGDVKKNTVNVQIMANLTRSQEQQYEPLNGVISQNNHCHTSQETEPDGTRSMLGQMYDGHDPANAVKEYQVDGNDHDSMGQNSTPRQESTTRMAVAISPNDTEELSSFDSAHVRIDSSSPVRELSQATPEDPFDESPPRAPVQRKPGRKSRATVVDDSDESPDELNPSVDPPKERRIHEASRTRSNQPGADILDDDDDISIVPLEKRDSQKGRHGAKPGGESAAEPVEDQQPAGSEDTNSDEMNMPPKEQYKPRPSRSRGKPVEPDPEPPEVPQKQPRKKKVKRGKTTPALLKKSLESDVEDDVIWVDDKPADVIFRDPVLPARRKAKRGKAIGAYAEPKVVDEEEEEGEGEGTIVDNEPNPVEQSEEAPLSNKVEKPIEATEPAPKKRGRPKKKTETPTEKHKPKQKDETSNPKTKALPNNSEKADDPPVEQQDEPIPEPLTNSHGDKDSKTPEPENRKLSSPEIACTETLHPVDTPKKQTTSTKTPSATEETMTPPPKPTWKGPNKHSPISASGSVPYRVGLSRRANIAPLLKVVRK